jgi:dCMP deaminase
MSRAQDKAERQNAAEQFGYDAAIKDFSRRYVIERFNDPTKREDRKKEDLQIALAGYDRGASARQAALYDETYGRHEREKQLVEAQCRRNWQDYFMGFADHAATKSKDPSTKVGAVIVQGDCVVATGFNGFPRKLADTDLTNRAHKITHTVHAEQNAILNALEHGVRVRGGRMFVTFPPCHDCALLIVQAGIVEVACRPLPEHRADAWRDSAEHAMALFQTCGVNFYTMHKDYSNGD